MYIAVVDAARCTSLMIKCYRKIPTLLGDQRSFIVVVSLAGVKPRRAVKKNQLVCKNKLNNKTELSEKR
jgi:hypothetical protein